MEVLGNYARPNDNSTDWSCSQVETTEEINELKTAYVAGNCESVENTGSSWKVNVKPEGSCKLLKTKLLLCHMVMS